MYARQLGDSLFRFIVSGRLWRNSLIMQDLETNTFWSHVTGKAVLGPLEGKELKVIPAVQTTWREWRSAHPRTRVLKKSEEVGASAYEEYSKDPKRTGIFRAQWLQGRLPGKQLIYGISLGTHAVAVVDRLLKERPLLQIRLGQTPLLLVKNPDGGVRGYVAGAAGKHLTFELAGPGNYRDRETGSQWNLISGKCEGGKLQGNQLQELQVTVAYWFAWSGFYPNSEVRD